MILRILCLLAASLFLSACINTGDRTRVEVGYYDVRGTSFDELDQQIALHGPKVAGVGNAVASTAVSMSPDIYFGLIDGKCRVVRARINVKANVTLPKLRDINSAKAEMRGAFSNIERYARLHEAVHVAIADSHAEDAEKAILALPPQKDCKTLQSKILRILERMMADHQKAQLRFDAEEATRLKQKNVS